MGFIQLTEPDQVDMGLITTNLEVTVNPFWRKDRFEVSPGDPDTYNIRFVHEVQNWVFNKSGREVTVKMQRMP